MSATEDPTKSAAPIGPDDPLYPRFRATLKAALEQMGFGRDTATGNLKMAQHRKSKRDESLINRVDALSMKFGAIRRLAWEIDSSDELGDAAAQGVEALSILGALEADAISRILGGMGVGLFDEKLADLRAPGAPALTKPHQQT